MRNRESSFPKVYSEGPWIAVPTGKPQGSRGRATETEKSKNSVHLRQMSLRTKRRQLHELFKTITLRKVALVTGEAGSFTASVSFEETLSKKIPVQQSL